MKDKLFGQNEDWPNPFEFNEVVAVCFDDMVKRSVPLYEETIKVQAKLAKQFYKEGTKIYDLGCSNGNFGMEFLRSVGKIDFSMTAVDNSEAMIEIYNKRLESRDNSNRVEVICSDISDICFENVSVVVMNLTMQFIKPEARIKLVQKIYDALIPGGIFLLTEKVLNHDSEFEEIQQEIYYDFKKKNGYSELEINRKREALDNVLIPESVPHHINRLTNAGFNFVDVYMKWFQFTSFIARKD